MTETKGGKRIRSEAFTAGFFCRRGALLIGVFVVVHLLGLREYTSFLSGTTGSSGLDLRTSAFLGLLYVCLYLGAVVVAPILIIAAAFLWTWFRLTPPRSPLPAPSSHDPS